MRARRGPSGSRISETLARLATAERARVGHARFNAATAARMSHALSSLERSTPNNARLDALVDPTMSAVSLARQGRMSGGQSRVRAGQPMPPRTLPLPRRRSTPSAHKGVARAAAGADGRDRRRARIVDRAADPDRDAPAPGHPRSNGRGPDRAGEDRQPDGPRQPACVPGGDVRGDRGANRQRLAVRRARDRPGRPQADQRHARPHRRRRAHQGGRRVHQAGRRQPRRGAPHRRGRVHGHPARPAEHSRPGDRAQDRPGDAHHGRVPGRLDRAHRVDRGRGAPDDRRPGRPRPLRGETDEAQRRRVQPRPREAGRRRRSSGRRPAPRRSSVRSPPRSRVPSTPRTSAPRATARPSRNCASAIGERIGLADHRLERLRLAGLLHDVGKIGIADAILQKPRPLEQ